MQMLSPLGWALTHLLESSISLSGELLHLLSLLGNSLHSLR
jgi:hypothetical protein